MKTPWVTVMLVLAAGCGGEGEGSPTPAEPTEVWVEPTFEGDGLPASEGTDHQTSDSTGGDSEGTPPPEEDPEAEPTLTLVDGLFGYQQGEKGAVGTLVLLSASVGCHAMFGQQDASNPDGLYFSSILPGEPKAPDWVGDYPACGKPPCYREGYVVKAGEYQSFSEGDSFTILSWDDHYVSASWETNEGRGELRFYNCGDLAAWAY